MNQIFQALSCNFVFQIQFLCRKKFLRSLSLSFHSMNTKLFPRFYGPIQTIKRCDVHKNKCKLTWIYAEHLEQNRQQSTGLESPGPGTAGGRSRLGRTVWRPACQITRAAALQSCSADPHPMPAAARFRGTNRIPQWTNTSARDTRAYQNEILSQLFSTLVRNKLISFIKWR